MTMTPERALAAARGKDRNATQFVVRLYDGFDGEWMDVSGPLSPEAAKEAWSKHTEGGTRKTHYNDIDYYAIYPTTVKMVYADGNSMTRAPAKEPAAELREFGQAIDSAIAWQGGTVTLHYYGCRNCGNAFWTEGDDKRRLKPGTTHPCPHCGKESIVPKEEE